MTHKVAHQLVSQHQVFALEAPDLASLAKACDDAVVRHIGRGEDGFHPGERQRRTGVDGFDPGAG
jgi:hypothetical protein